MVTRVLVIMVCFVDRLQNDFFEIGLLADPIAIWSVFVVVLNKPWVVISILKTLVILLDSIVTIVTGISASIVYYQILFLIVLKHSVVRVATLLQVLDHNSIGTIVT